jgi:phage regulator Rha-like protein
MQNQVAMAKRQATVIPAERIAARIYLIRGEKVMLDSDLAELYGVQTGRLNEQVRRNIERFPKDFAIQLTRAEFDSLRSQIATLKDGGRGRHRKYLPYVFTEHGVAMLSSVLRSKTAVQINIEIIRAFVRVRQMLATNEELARKVQQLDHKVTILHDNFQRFIAPPNPPKKNPIGYVPAEDD